MAIPALSVPLVFAIAEGEHDPYNIVRTLCFITAALGACVSGIGGLMVWVGRTEKG